VSLFIPPGSSEFERRVAIAINLLLRRSLSPSATAPGNPQPGDAYFDTTDSIGKVWDGTAWKPLW
jgi:hypothetical protein